MLICILKIFYFVIHIFCSTSGYILHHATSRYITFVLPGFLKIQPALFIFFSSVDMKCPASATASTPQSTVILHYQSFCTVSTFVMKMDFKEIFESFSMATLSQ